MTTLDPKTTALILIDLQKGILPYAGGPRSGDEVVAAAKPLATRFREAGAPVVLVHVGFTPETMPSQTVDRPSLPPQGTPPEFSELVPDLRQPGDIVVLKHHWGAFTGTDLDLHLRRRGVRTVVIAGISTNMGVESTARSAWELSYDVVIAEDACASRSSDLHAFTIQNILPHIARVVASGDIMLKG
ncbi:hydrolase [Sphingomonas fuzhouensis]|uniref:hydrolase n=1 Tax=Sphingomonas fuzhouensis TaxID=3106033 RepID=UPI002B00230D|nr:hydrolase [Sphingomonas sp. SGZ-02]